MSRDKSQPPLNKADSIEFLLDFYDAWLRDDSWDKVAAALTIDGKALRTRIKTHPNLQYAKDLADTRRGQRGTLKGYIFKRLSVEAKQAWDELQFWEGGASTHQQIESILKGKTKELRQELFIHALVSSNFDTSSAMQMVGVSRDCLMTWRKDLPFRQLIEEIQWHKKNFFETALIDLIEERHPGAVIFANKTVNADRGYAEKLQVQHSGKVEVGFSLEQLNLPLDVRRAILVAIDQAKVIELEKNPLQITRTSSHSVLPNENIDDG